MTVTKPSTKRTTKKPKEYIAILGHSSDAIHPEIQSLKQTSPLRKAVAAKRVSVPESTPLLGFDVRTLSVLFAAAETRKLPADMTLKEAMPFFDANLVVNHFPYDYTRIGVTAEGRKLIAKFTKQVVNLSLKLM